MLSDGEMLLRLGLAAVLGSAVGFERERLLWAAGLRTHMLVCVGATLVMIVSAFGFADVLMDEHVNLDPSRIAAQVVSGIGFLGAGTILLRGDVIRGLTTAASLWSVAAIGLAVGGGLYVPALATTFLILLILAGIKPLEQRFRERIALRTVRLTAAHGTITLDTVHRAAGVPDAKIKQFVLHRRGEEPIDDITVSFIHLSREAVEEITERFRALPGVSSAMLTDIRSVPEPD